jgi:hypothetical protein
VRKIIVVLIGFLLVMVGLMSGCIDDNQEDTNGTDTNGSDGPPDDDTDGEDTDGEDETPDGDDGNQTAPDEFLQQAEPYIQKMVFDSSDLYTYAYGLVDDFDASSRECRINALYRDVVINYTCVAAPLGSTPLQTPQETMQNKQGTCEDLTILLASLLFTIGIPTYLVFTDEHVYALAYDVNTDTLWECAEQSLIHHVETLFDEEMYQHLVQPVVLPPAGALYIGGDNKTFDGLIDYMTIEYSFQSNQPLHMFVVPTQTEFFSLRDNGTANTSYEEPNLTNKTGTIPQMTTFGGIVLLNNNTQTATVNIDFIFTFQPSFYATYNKNKLTAYTIDGKTCVLLDPTIGDFGFPGYDAEVAGQKTAINPLTKHYIVFP